jgi:arsenite transporter
LRHLAQPVRRRALTAGGSPAALQNLLQKPGPVSLVALLTTPVLPFGFRGEEIVAQPAVIALPPEPPRLEVRRVRQAPPASRY